jgi:predicted dinucleotide-binding enzyme
LDVLFACDDARAKASVSAFIESLGLRPLDAGGLEMAHWLEGTALLMISLAPTAWGPSTSPSASAFSAEHTRGTPGT